MDRFKNTYNMLSKGGIQMRTKKRSQKMFIFGGTIGASRYPLYLKDGKKKMLPRPVVLCRPGNIGYNMMKNMTWLQELSKDIEDLCIHHLSTQNDISSKSILDKIHLSKKCIPSSLRICNTCFTQMAMVGDVNTEGYINNHIDKKDLISGILTLGEKNITGGSTQYFQQINLFEQNTPSRTTMILSQEVPFQHGRVQIGCFDKITHGVSKWSGGTRMTLNFNLKKPILDFFLSNEKEYYQIYEQSGYAQKALVLEQADLSDYKDTEYDLLLRGP